jgi:hypothetical protein
MVMVVVGGPKKMVRLIVAIARHKPQVPRIPVFLTQIILVRHSPSSAYVPPNASLLGAVDRVIVAAPAVVLVTIYSIFWDNGETC